MSSQETSTPASCEGGKAPPASPRQGLRETYAGIAEGAIATAPACCGGTPGSEAFTDLYGDAGGGSVPAPAKALSLGCGNPGAIAGMRPGQRVLDLGSGGGLDCFLAAERVGESGCVVGVDMTPEMVEKARATQRQMGLRNVEFRLGEMEHLPVADASFDIVLANCAINLAADKVQVFREAYRALAPGGALVISEPMTATPLPAALRAAIGPLADGICAEGEYRAALEAAGFVSVELVGGTPAPSPPASAEGTAAPARGTARVVVRVAETGEERTVEVDPAALGELTNGSFSGTLSARKPA